MPESFFIQGGTYRHRAARKAVKGDVMNVVMFPIVVLGGVLGGWLVGFVMERGGYGLKWDIVLGLAGSAVGSWIFWALGVYPGAGLAALMTFAK